MIYRFSGNDPTGKFEIQLEDVEGKSIEKRKRMLEVLLLVQGFRTGPLQYEGSVDVELEDLMILPDADVERRYITVQTEAAEDEKYPPVGWYTPGGNEPAHRKCIVHECEGDAVFHLCQKHAAPGRIVEDRKSRGKYVVSKWLVEDDGCLLVFPIHDLLLGKEFGGRETLEKRLAVQGFKILRVSQVKVIWMTLVSGTPSYIPFRPGSGFPNFSSARPGAASFSRRSLSPAWKTQLAS